LSLTTSARSRSLTPAHSREPPLIPAKAGIQTSITMPKKTWVPAFAGMGGEACPDFPYREDEARTACLEHAGFKWNRHHALSHQ
jgi:hypothetical protein